MLKIRRPLGRLIFNMGIAIPGKTVFLIETAPWSPCTIPFHLVVKSGGKQVNNGLSQFANYMIKNILSQGPFCVVIKQPWCCVSFGVINPRAEGCGDPQIILHSKFPYLPCHLITWPRLCGTLFINTLRPRQHGRHFADDTFKRIFLNENVIISIKISLMFVPKDPINNIPALVQIMAWRRPGDKPLSEAMMVSLLTHICVTRPQWENACQSCGIICHFSDMFVMKTTTQAKQAKIRASSCSYIPINSYILERFL